MKELMIIETKNSEELESLLIQEKINYQIIYRQEIRSTEEEYRRDLRLANRDEKRTKEIAGWDEISDEDDWKDIKNEEWE